MAFCRRDNEERAGGNWREGEIHLNHWNPDTGMDVCMDEQDEMDRRNNGRWRDRYRSDEGMSQIN